MSTLPGPPQATDASALLPMLHAIQDELGYVPAARVPAIAAALNISRAEVHGVLTYYPHFRAHAPGRHVVQVCRAEACQACGGNELLDHVERRLGCRAGQTRADGAVTVEAVYCLGLCASSPAIQVDDRLHARVDAARFDRIAAALESTR
ncbi:MAG: formate dehydrogenase subunit gamma [Burkholderiales bacterium]|nr:formate dehydrogenase subunit gamma [Burkholderiales bacterium]MDE1928159.1 formate dehydrogenase subunit gamma [Burkholderiales bacterium]MDE2158625.1 formate dehydrogenase subunit gamma [Burkholderiales bacterium]MDE2505551.1 formate dehydrogenase subunit gamma [Burkholderiales bacterium]